MEMISPPHAVHDNFISNLGSTFNESLCIQDAQKSEHASDVDGKYDVVEDNLHGVQQIKLSKKCLKKCATFPYSAKMLDPSSSDEEDGEADISLTESFSEQSAQTYSRSMSLPALPTPLKLVSAMKGSREKQGGSRMKLTVKWAPDVYDPIPSFCHTVKSKRQQKSKNKKNGKKGHKGNSSRGCSGRDKRQIRKVAGTSELCYKSLDSRDEASTELDAFEVSCQDPYCGTSFLKKSATQVHYSVAEAL